MTGLAWRLSAVIISIVCALFGAVQTGQMTAQTDSGGAVAQSACALPCVFGIMPGITTRLQAIGIAEARSVGGWRETIRDVYFYIPDALGRSVLVALDFTPPPQERVRTIRFSPRDAGASLLRLGDILRRGLHRQVSVLRACETTITRLVIIKDAGITISAALMAQHRLSPTDELLMLEITSAARQRAPYEANPFGCFQRARWGGFAPFFSLMRS